MLDGCGPLARLVRNLHYQLRNTCRYSCLCFDRAMLTRVGFERTRETVETKCIVFTQLFPSKIILYLAQTSGNWWETWFSFSSSASVLLRKSVNIPLCYSYHLLGYLYLSKLYYFQISFDFNLWHYKNDFRNIKTFPFDQRMANIQQDRQIS